MCLKLLMNMYTPMSTTQSMASQAQVMKNSVTVKFVPHAEESASHSL
tara:strand:+ start:613 stop:753 length:141 start_codon:yes stop_codon:yes gene_type:complete